MRNANQGFTLLELLVAMTIFASMSIMAYSGLSNAIVANDVITEKEEKLKVLQRAMTFIDRDLRQLVLRSRTSGYDQTIQAFTYGLDSDGLLEFTRAGNANPTGMPRSSLQRIRYDFDDNKLIRNSWNIVDHLELEPVNMTLLDEVDSIELRLLDGNNEWKTNWTSQNSLPIVVELSLEHKHWGKIQRLIPIK